MTACVVDASVAVKWYVPEPMREESLRLLDDAWELHAPDLLHLELDSVLSRRVRRQEMPTEKASEIRAAVREVPITVYRTPELLDSAFAVATQTGASVYDSVYLALAILLDAPLITADRKLATALRPTPWRDRVQWVGEIQ